jgi:penicillin-binding protein 1A
VVVVGLLAGGVGGVILYLELTADLPPVDQLLSYRPPIATRVYADDGAQIAEFFVERRYLVPFERIPPHVRQAFLASEDADFYQHRGVDPISIARAVWANVRAGGVVQGASTITQQLVKILLLTPERRVERKVKEAILAVRLESKLDKDQILHMYLNEIYFGAGAYGVQAAARTYFRVDAEDLSVAQAALLAGLPQKPSDYNPRRNLPAALRRQRYVLRRMLEEKFVDAETYRAAAAEEIAIAEPRPTGYETAPWYVEHVRRLLEQRYGGQATAQLGLHVYTAVNVEMQRTAEEAVRTGLRELDQRQGFRGAIKRLEPAQVDAYLTHERGERDRIDGLQHAVVTSVTRDGLRVRTPWHDGSIPADRLRFGTTRLDTRRFHEGDVLLVTPDPEAAAGARFLLDQEPQVQGALIAFDPYTGGVKAMVGGYEFARTHFNRAVQAQRQPGSAFKPLLYAAALEHGYTAASVVLDAPISFPDSGGKVWSPKNYGGRYYGPIPLRSALTKSLNTVSVRLADSMGSDYLSRYLGRFGFSRPLPRNLSIALGSSEVTLLELVRAYGVFATLGKRFEPIFITDVTDDAGRPIEFGETKPNFERVMAPAAAYVVTNLLESVVQNGTGRRAVALGRPLAGKTGTTNDSRDAWFVGFSPDLLAGVWVGFDSDRALGPRETGSRAALPIWMTFMGKSLEGRPVVDFPKPPGLSYVHVDPETGLRAVPGGASLREVFVAGSEPTEYAPLPSLDDPYEDGDEAGYDDGYRTDDGAGEDPEAPSTGAPPPRYRRYREEPPRSPYEGMQPATY